MNYFRNSMGPEEKCLRDRGIDKRNVHDVVLVGGSTRIPIVQKMIQEFFNGRDPDRSINCDEAVAFGAAVQVAIFTGEFLHRCRICCCWTSLFCQWVWRLLVVSWRSSSNVTPPFTRKRDRLSRRTLLTRGVLIQVFEGERAMIKDNKFAWQVPSRWITASATWRALRLKSIPTLTRTGSCTCLPRTSSLACPTRSPSQTSFLRH